MTSADTDKQLRDYLPDSVHELLAVISAESVAALIEAYPGIRIQIPKTADAEHGLVVLIGQDDFKKLCARYQGTSISIPRCSRFVTIARDIRLLNDRRSGLSLAQLALKHKLTERGVSKALRRIEKQEYQPWVKQAAGWSQGDLFNDH